MSADSYLEVQTLLADHYRNPRHWGVAAGGASRYGRSPGCGDEQVIYATARPGGEVVLSFRAKGCALSRASTSILLEYVEGLSWAEISVLDESVLLDLLGPEVVHSRPKCALLGLGLLRELAQQRHGDPAEERRGEPAERRRG
ncbi:iron-sulfur cluster assembly scaffold protein [Micromonospora sp. NPDC049559]|uniref:iron-sulfur cluster assembly scaffold protein n=1 Tax=Micromonospora sp. NPDC049559 TaxID=3155923 RepID=UPI0034437993